MAFRRTTLHWSRSGPSPNEAIETELYTFRNAGQCMTARPRAAASAYGSLNHWHVQLQVHMTWRTYPASAPDGQPVPESGSPGRN